MNFKALITALVLAGTSTAALAQPIVRDHRGDTTQVVRDHREQPTATYQTKVKTTARPSWMASVNANVNYGFQVDRDGDEAQGYRYGQDPIVEGIRRDQWATLNPCVEIKGHQAQRVDTANKPLRSVEIQATRGDAHLYTIGVLYVDGTQQAFKINRELDATHAPNLRIDLGPQGRRGVAAVVVDGVGNTSFRVIGA